MNMHALCIYKLFWQHFTLMCIIEYSKPAEQLQYKNDIH